VVAAAAGGSRRVTRGAGFEGGAFAAGAFVIGAFVGVLAVSLTGAAAATSFDGAAGATSLLAVGAVAIFNCIGAGELGVVPDVFCQ
jgi:hypothetical protein